MQAFRRRIVAGVRQAVVDTEVQAGANDFRFAELNQRRTWRPCSIQQLLEEGSHDHRDIFQLQR